MPGGEQHEPLDLVDALVRDQPAQPGPRPRGADLLVVGALGVVGDVVVPGGQPDGVGVGGGRRQLADQPEDGGQVGQVVIAAVRLAPRGDEGGPLGARGGGVAGQRGPGLEADQPGHRTPQVRSVSSAKARAAVTTSATGTFSSGPCARFRSPGP